MELSIIQQKTKVFAIRIVGCYNYLVNEKHEMEYWLDLLHETEFLDDRQFESLISDCKELIAILVSIVKTIKMNLEKK